MTMDEHPKPGDRVVDFETEYEIVSMTGTMPELPPVADPMTGLVVALSSPPTELHGVSKSGVHKTWRREQLTKLPLGNHTWTDT